MVVLLELALTFNTHMIHDMATYLRTLLNSASANSRLQLFALSFSVHLNGLGKPANFPKRHRCAVRMGLSQVPTRSVHLHSGRFQDKVVKAILFDLDGT